MKTLLLTFLIFPTALLAQKLESHQFTMTEDSAYVMLHYDKAEYMVAMRDGIKLFTQVYTPKDVSKTHGVIMQRTPYSCSPYGIDKFKKRVSPNSWMLRDDYIVVYQDVRGRWASEGLFVEMTPVIDNKKNKKEIDEGSDTFDTIEWLIKNIKSNNGRVGQWGISYPGFFASAGTISFHPALKASSPQAPMADLRRDDAFHNGAFMLAANFGFYPHFQNQSAPNKDRTPPLFRINNPDGYDFYLKLGPLKNAEDVYFKKRNTFFSENFDHPNYDEHWKARNILPHLKNIKHAVMIVGGWYDAEDLYGTFKTYEAIEKQNPGIENIFVVGPWVHGGWAGASGESLGDVSFGQKTSPWFQENIEAKFFRHYLTGDTQPLGLPEATIFETGTNQWRQFDSYPPQKSQSTKLYFNANGALTFEAPSSDNSYSEFVSDPAHPVPYSAMIGNGVTRSYMVEDQRFASERPDVVTFQSDTLTNDITLSGNIMANLNVSTTGTDADWVVKVIDVYPSGTPNDKKFPDVTFGGYQQLIRSDILRGKFRNNPEKPEAFVPNKVTPVTLELQDVLHTFKKGHRIMVQIQSSCFPWADRNPQTFTDIFKANAEDYQKATHRIYCGGNAPSYITVGVLKH